MINLDAVSGNMAYLPDRIVSVRNVCPMCHGCPWIQIDRDDEEKKGALYPDCDGSRIGFRVLWKE